jgi:hypothetical protein
MAAMRLSRFFLPVLFAFALLSAQQVGAEHALSHAFEEQSQKDKQAPHSNTCEKCATYAQLGSALSVGNYDFSLPQASDEVVRHYTSTFHHFNNLVADARGPPAHLQYFA